MTLKPQKLSKGWFLRCVIGAITLSLRAPLVWLVLYVCLPILTFYVPYLPIATFIAGIILIFGTALSFTTNHMSKYGFKDYFALLLIKPQILILLGVSCLLSFVFFRSSFYLDAKTPLEMLFTFSQAYLSLYITLIFSSITVLIFYDFPLAFWNLYKKRSVDNQVISGSFSPFALHLMIDTSMDWNSACKMSTKGVELLEVKERIILLSLLTSVLIFPVALGFLVPFFFTVYRELFLGTGITQREKAKVLSHA